MQPNENLRKIVKIFVFAFLCSEMQSSHTPFAISQQFDVSKFELENSLKNVSVASAQNARHYASIRLINEDKKNFGAGHICAGALVASSVVLTVAHCIHKSTDTAYHPSELRVVLGNLQLHERADSTLVLGVTHIHPSPHNELAVLMLERDVPAALHAHVQPIAYATTHMLASGACVAATLNVTSWCAHQSLRVELPMLLTLNATMLCTEQCPAQKGVFYVRYATKDVTPQSVGAALLMHDKLLGLSMQMHVDGVQKAVAYVDVGAHAQWLDEQIGDGSNQNSGVWGMLGILAFTAYTLWASRGCVTK